MNANHYGRAFASMFQRSMRGKGALSFAVWTYICSHAYPAVENGQEIGLVEINPEVLAFLIGDCTEEQVSNVIHQFCQPDPKSQSPDEEGRKLVHVSGFIYRVVNFLLYRRRESNSPEAIANRNRVRRHRAKLRAMRLAQPPEDDPNVINTNGGVAKPTNYWSMARKVLEYFNEVAGTDFIASDNSALNSICACLAMDAVTFDGVKAMIDNQVAEKRGTPNEKWLTPTTLFDIEKFGGYYGRRNTQVSKNHHVNPVAQLKSVEATIADINKKLTAFETVDASSQPEKAKRVAEQKKPLLDERRVLKETQSRLNREIAAMKQ